MIYDTQGKKAPIEYKGFKSKLEYIAVEWLTNECKLKILYEPFTYKTKIGNYTPDFYCKEINQYFECKPNINFANTDLYLQFCEEKQTELIIITPEKLYMYDFDFECNNYETSEVLIIKCSKCNMTSFVEQSGNYYCRNCKNHDGMHDIRKAKSIIKFKDYYSIISKKLRGVYE